MANATWTLNSVPAIDGFEFKPLGLLKNLWVRNIAVSFSLLPQRNPHAKSR